MGSILEWVSVDIHHLGPTCIFYFKDDMFIKPTDNENYIAWACVNCGAQYIRAADLYDERPADPTDTRCGMQGMVTSWDDPW